MDDDISFGASVWGSTDTPTPTLPTVLKPPPLSPAPILSPQDSFDDFDEFGTPAETVAASEVGDDDDFGDFGEFGDTVEAGPSSAAPTFNDNTFYAEPEPLQSQDWHPLRVTSETTLEEIQQQTEELLGPLWPHVDPSLFHDRPLRQVGGLSQILINPESRRMYEYLCPSQPPEIPPVNWTRSRIRRQQLIALGVPVNLDEVLPPSGGKLPTLQITTRPTSAPPGPSPVSNTKHHVTSTANNSRAGTPRSGTPQPGNNNNNSLAAAQMRFGPRPELDMDKIERLLDLSTDDLSLLPLKTVENHLHALKEQTAQTSVLLTYLLQTRDALQQDSETYNKLIGEMVGEAQKMKSGKRLGASSRRGSAMS